MKVSAVIPTYNSGKLVVEAIRSVLGQTYAPFEVIVVDDGSKDDTRDRLTEFGSRVRYAFQANQGVAAARNHGIRLATGDAVAFLDADDAWHPRKLERQVECLNAHPELGLVGTAIVNWPIVPFSDLSGQTTSQPIVIPLDDLIIRNKLVASSVLVRRSILEKVGEFDQSMFGTEDYDLWLRIAQETQIANLPEPLTGYRESPGSLSKNAAQMEAGMEAILHKLTERQLFRGRPLLRRRAWAYFRCSCAYMYSIGGRHSVAVWRLLQSLGGYPLPYTGGIMKHPFGRLRLLLRSVVRWVRSPASKSASPIGNRA